MSKQRIMQPWEFPPGVTPGYYEEVLAEVATFNREFEAAGGLKDFVEFVVQACIEDADIKSINLLEGRDIEGIVGGVRFLTERAQRYAGLNLGGIAGRLSRLRGREVLIKKRSVQKQPKTHPRKEDWDVRELL